MDAREPDSAAPLTHRETKRVVFGVLLPVFMGSLDQTILASTLPTIGREFGDFQTLPWLISAYLIASTAVTPLYGKIADIHGRRVTLIVAIAIYMVGSLACALAPNMFVLVVARVVHGLGGGGFTSLGLVVLGDVATPRDRGKYYGYFSVVYTTAGASAPALGGFFAEYLHWSLIFWCNIGMGVIALVLTRSLRRLPRYERWHRLDLVGAALIMAASSTFMLAINMGGARLPWMSPLIVSLLAAALVLGIAFVLRLATAPEPLIPIAILADPVARCAVLAAGFGWGSIVGLNIFLPVYLQTVIGLSATSAGLGLMVLMATLNISAGLAGQVLGRVKHYKRLPIIALATATGAVLVLAWRGDSLTIWTFEILLAVIGLGFGPLPPLTQVVLQNAVRTHQFGSAIGTMNFARNLLSTVLVAVFGALVLATPPEGGTQIAVISAGSFGRVFLAAAACLSIALVAIIILEERPLKGDRP
jgi:MFS family permease